MNQIQIVKKYKIQIKKKRNKNDPLTENEIWSYDLDGWSFELPKIK